MIVENFRAQITKVNGMVDQMQKQFIGGNKRLKTILNIKTLKEIRWLKIALNGIFHMFPSMSVQTKNIHTLDGFCVAIFAFGFFPSPSPSFLFVR